MARSVQQIMSDMEAQKNTEPDLAPLTNSLVGKWRLLKFIFASCANYLEQLWDEFREELEALLKNNVPGTEAWWQDQMKKFQYDTVTPQVVQLVNFYPQYAVVDPTRRIITHCSVKQQTNRVVKIKVAKGASNSAVELLAPELNAAKAYASVIQPAGVAINVISLPADYMMVSADVYYDGQYVSASVQSAVATALDNYMQALPFDGVVRVSAVEDAIQAVPGVKDVVVNEIKCRPYSQSLSVTSPISVKYETSSGYIVQENTPGSTFADTINMILFS